MKKKIFISYQRQQQQQIEALTAALIKTDAYEIWFDQELQGGQKWWEEIIRRIETADVIILALSQSYFTSEYCKREWQYAHDRNKVLIPIKIDSALPYDAIPNDISKWQITAYDGQASQFQKLDAAIRAVSAEKPGFVPNRFLLAGIALVVIVVVALVLFSVANNPLRSASNGQPTDMAATVPEGFYNFTLIYGEANSLSLKLNSESNLSGLTFETPGHIITLAESFSALTTTGAVAADKTCFRFIRAGTTPSLPMGCSRSATFETTLSDDEVFWYETAENTYQDVTLKYGGVIVGSPCPHANGSGRCEMSRQVEING